MKGWQRLSKCLLACALCFTGMFSGIQISVKAAALENLALGKSVTASVAYGGNEDERAAERAKLTDGNEADDSRFRTEAAAPQWVYVDLGESKTMNKFEAVWENDTHYASAFNIYVSDNAADWNKAAEVSNNTSKTSTVELTEAVNARYVKLEVTAMYANDEWNSVSCREFKVFHDPTVSSRVNIALNKTVTASVAYGSNEEEQAVERAKLTDGSEADESRFKTEAAAPQWAYVDLGKTMTMNKFEAVWENGTHYASAFNIYVSDNAADWNKVAEVNNNASATSTVILPKAVNARYVKLEVTAMYANDMWNSVSCREFRIYNETVFEQDPMENVALHKAAVASSVEDNSASLAADKFIDGDTTHTRWGSGSGDTSPWIYVDLGRAMDVKTIKLFWETRKATSYRLQIADTLSGPMADSDWTTVKTMTTRPSSKNEKIVLDEVKKARYVRLAIDAFDAQDPDGPISWPTISLYEMEIYGGDIKASIDDIVNSIAVSEPQQGDAKLNVSYTQDEAFTVTYNGTDLEQVVDEDQNIHQPIVAKTVNVSFKVVDKESGEYRFKEIPVVIPGKYTPAQGDNAAPDILPELQEWKGESGTFTPSAATRVVYANSELKETAEIFAQDYLDITGKTMSVVQGNAANAGEFFLSLTTDKTKGLQDEGYLMEISDKVNVEAETTTGAFWATRSILQSIKQTGTIPCGIARDYPLYKVRGYILDVGRKTFKMDFLEQMVKQMSWYKMNDFQIHINDNLIPLENLSDPMSAYSAFRLESDIKKGGNNGLNQADLTSTDVFYTKDEFRNLIKESRLYGVDIVPEIDVPAHSLALTKVRPDLRHGLSGRENDHLNLTTKYADSLAFVQSIFNEYMSGSDPVFDAETIVHVGADEYTADGSAYRRFANDMLSYVADSGRQARIWGSLTTIKGNVEVRGEGVQMNLWNGGWADMKEMYNLGFDLINCNDGQYYIVPNAGYYYDYLNDNTLYNAAINQIGNNYVPVGDKQMLGGAFAVWNDMTDYLENGITEYDVYDRSQNAVALLGAKLWGKGTKDLAQANTTRKQLGDAPNTNFGYEVETKDNQDAIAHYPMDDMSDVSGNGYDLREGVNAKIDSVDGRNALKLNGGESYVSTPIETAGLGNDLRVKVKRTSVSKEEQILFESDYGTFKAVQKDTGKVGFSRENRDFSFDYTLPLNQWVELEFKNQQNEIHLYVNGIETDILGDNEITEDRPLIATAMLPMARIGSKDNAFIGYVDDIRIGSDDGFNSTMELDYALLKANAVDSDDAELANLVKQAEALLKEYAPTASDIQGLSDQINQKLDSLSFEQADYSEVEKYLALVPADTSAFTDASVAQLQSVIDSIQADLPISMQETVDGYARALAAALQGLEVKAVQNANYIDASTLTVTASSYQDASSAPNKAIDNDPSTMWHTDWSITTGDHWIDFAMASASKVNGLTYVPRSGGGNGHPTQYEIQISDNGVDYTTVKSGTMTNNGDTKVIEFTAVTTTHVRFVIKNGINGNGSAAEIMLHDADAAADMTGLNAIINSAKAITNDGYTQSSWDALQDLISEAEGLAAQAKPNANDVEVMKRKLTKAMTALEYPADKSILKQLIAQIEALNEHDYTAASWNELKTLFDTAKTIDTDDQAIQDTVDLAVEQLKNAIDKLVEIVAPVNKTELTALLNDAKALDKDQYTAEGVADLETAIASAEAIETNEKATQAQVDKAVDDLKQAIDHLVKKVNKAELTALLNDVKALDKDQYMAEGVADLETAIANAEAIETNENATQAQVDKAVDDLKQAIDHLVKKANKTELTALLNDAKALDKDQYMAEGVADLETAIANAEAIETSENATQAQVDKAVDDLKQVIDHLVKKANKTELTTLLNSAKALDTSKYAPAGVAALKTAISAAETVEKNNDATQAQVDKALDDLKQAINQLKENTPSSVENIVLEEVKQGITVNASSDVIDPKTELQVLEIEEAKNISEAAVEALEDVEGKYTAYDIKLLLEGKEVQPNGTITISMKIPNGYDADKIALFHVNDNGKMTAVNFTVKGDKVVFKTNHLSIYAIIQLDQTAVNPLEPTKPLQPNDQQALQPVKNHMDASAPETGDQTTLSCYAWICLGAGIIAWIAYKRREESKHSC